MKGFYSIKVAMAFLLVLSPLCLANAENGRGADGSYTVVRLQNPTAGSWYYSVTRVFLTGDRIIVYDTNGLSQYGMDGRLIKTDSLLRGDKRNQYGYVKDVALDEKERELYVYTTNPSKIIVTDYDFNHKRTLDMDYNSVELCVSGNYLYALTKDGRPGVYRILRFDKDRFNESPLAAVPDTLLSYDRTLDFNFGNVRFLNANGASVYATLPFDDTIYYISDGRVAQSWRVPLDDWFDYDKYKDAGPGNMPKDLLTSTSYYIGSVSGNGASLVGEANLCNFTMSTTSTTDKLTKSVFGLEKTYVFVVPSQGRAGSAVVRLRHLNSSVRDQLLSKAKEEGVGEDLISLMKEASQTDYPILLIFKL